MVYICTECHNLCTESELQFNTESSGEEYYSCPCGGAVEEAEKCAFCGEYHLKDDLESGLCKDCLREIKESLIDREKFRKYLIDTDQISSYMFWTCGIKEPKYVSEDLKAVLTVAYDVESSIRYDKSFEDRSEYVFNGGTYSLENYIGWLNKEALEWKKKSEKSV